jgi:hypothetical protein
MKRRSRRGAALKRRRLDHASSRNLLRPRVQRSLNRWHREAESHSKTLSAFCPDRGSQHRLARLVQRLSSHNPGAVESALAELELATSLVRAGFHISFLPECHAKTADLECSLGRERFVVEVTAMLESHAGAGGLGGWPEEEEAQALATRVMARIHQKAKQLLDYRAPVLLAINLPPDRHSGRLPKLVRRRSEEAVDLKRMAGTISLGLARCRHITAVLLSLWDKEPARDRSGLRLANVTIIERSSTQHACPRIRLLVFNPTADFPFQDGAVEALKGLL